MSRMHETAAIGFARSAEAYELGRPGLPGRGARAARGCRARLTVLDLAAGTGQAHTRTRRERGERDRRRAGGGDARGAARVGEGARRHGRGDPAGGGVRGPRHGRPGVPLVRRDRRRWPRSTACSGPAAAWRSCGTAAWRTRPVNRAIEALVEPQRMGTPTHRGDGWRAAFEGTSLFGPLEEHVFASEQVLDEDGLAARISSISFIARLPEPERAALLARARELTADGPVTVPYRTVVQIAERL